MYWWGPPRCTLVCNQPGPHQDSMHPLWVLLEWALRVLLLKQKYLLLLLLEEGQNIVLKGDFMCSFLYRSIFFHSTYPAIYPQVGIDPPHLGVTSLGSSLMGVSSSLVGMIILTKIQLSWIGSTKSLYDQQDRRLNTSVDISQRSCILVKIEDPMGQEMFNKDPACGMWAFQIYA